LLDFIDTPQGVSEFSGTLELVLDFRSSSVVDTFRVIAHGKVVQAAGKFVLDVVDNLGLVLGLEGVGPSEIELEISIIGEVAFEEVIHKINIAKVGNDLGFEVSGKTVVVVELSLHGAEVKFASEFFHINESLVDILDSFFTMFLGNMGFEILGDFDRLSDFKGKSKTSHLTN
jgi:hypothetical protein